MLFAGYVDITRCQSFGCLVLTKISQKINNLITGFLDMRISMKTATIALEAVQVGQ
jgi:hypothetical protein